MKTSIHSTHDAIAILLQGLYYTEITLRDTLPGCFSAIASTPIRDEFKKYSESAANKLLKVERVFNYLMTEPLSRKNESIHQLVIEMHYVLKGTTSAHLRDILGIGYIQNINTYKVSSYRSAYLFAVELELDTVTDLLQQVLEWEVEASKGLSQLAFDEFTRQQPAAQP